MEMNNSEAQKESYVYTAEKGGQLLPVQQKRCRSGQEHSTREVQEPQQTAWNLLMVSEWKKDNRLKEL